ncbi:MAG: twin-arginine translocase TatA/TatE family subunit [Bacteroidetes bacterium]|nr:twin-arginine translocase TatA/TatE family subunit [Bacteroidota bacterium]
MLDNFGFGEIFLIVIVVIVLFGPKRIPDIMQSVGKGVREFKRAMRDVQDEVNKAIEEKPEPKMTQQKQFSSSAPAQEIHPDSKEKTAEKV